MCCGPGADRFRLACDTADIAVSAVRFQHAAPPTKASCMSNHVTSSHSRLPLLADAPKAEGAPRDIEPYTLASLAPQPRWVAWQTECREGRPTKIPYAPNGSRAKADDPSTWGTRTEAAHRAMSLPRPCGEGGVGIELGELRAGICIGGIDLDSCRNPANGTIDAWAMEVVNRIASYAEVSPSKTGLKTYFTYSVASLPALRSAMGTDHGKMFKRTGGGEHPPAIELHLSNRYFAVTDQHLHGTPPHLQAVDLDTLTWLIRDVGPAFSRGVAPGHDAETHGDGSRSAIAFRKGKALRRDGATFDGMCDALRTDPETAAWVSEKGDTNGGRELRRIWDSGASSAADQPDPDLLADPDMSLLRLSRRPPPTLPLEVFGNLWPTWIIQAAEAAACPPDYVVAPLLASVSALIGNARWPQGTPGWAEPPHLWCGVVGDSGSGKSPGSDALMRDVLPIIERRMSAGFSEVLADYRLAADAHAASVERWKADMRKLKNGSNAPSQPPAGDPPSEPEMPRLRQTDTTVEKVAMLLAKAAPKGLLIVRDELAGWLLGMNSYNDAGRQFWIEAYGGRFFRVERQKHPQPIDVHHLAVAVTGGTQPDKLAQLMGAPDDGLLSRIAWFWPDPVPFKISRAVPDASWAVDALDRLRLLHLAPPAEPGANPEPIMVPLADEATAALEAFGQEMQERQHAAGGLMNSALGKARGTALRLALVLEYLWWCGRAGSEPPPAAISVEAFAAAAHFVADYLMPMAARVFGDAAASPADRNAATLARYIVRERPKEIHVRTLQRTVRLPGLTTADAIHGAAAVLLDAGWLYAPNPSGANGRPRAAYLVNPRVTERAA